MHSEKKIILIIKILRSVFTDFLFSFKKHEQQRPQHSSLCIYFVSSVQRYYSDLREKEKLPTVCLFHELFLIFLVSFFCCEQTNTTAPHIILIFLVKK